jgi:hypothetical protein
LTRIHFALSSDSANDATIHRDFLASCWQVRLEAAPFDSARPKDERNDTMRLKLLCAGIVGLAATALAQTSAAPELHLRGGRFQPLVYEQMTFEQKAMTNDVLKGERGSMNGPYNVLLRSPEMGDLAQKYGAYLRFH